MRNYININSIIILFILTIALSQLLIQGCKSDSGIIDAGKTDVIEETFMAKISSDIYTTLTKCTSILISKSNGINVDEYGCPSISNTGGFSTGTILMDYGTIPCISQKDNFRRSGKITMNYMFDTTSSDSIYAVIYFDNFRIYKNVYSNDTSSAYITGTDTIRMSRYSNIIYKFSFNIYKNIKSDSVSYRLGLKDTSMVNINTADKMEDDIYTITSTGFMNNLLLSKSYIMKTNEPENMIITGDCKYPIAGIINFQLDTSKSTIDFSPNNNDCDENITIETGEKIYYYKLNELSY